MEHSSKRLKMKNSEEERDFLFCADNDCDGEGCSEPGTAQRINRQPPMPHTTPITSITSEYLHIEKRLCEKLVQLDYGKNVQFVYNPVDYASEIHEDFVAKFCRGTKKVLLLGMNPGPWGMGQTGVPFGHVGYAKDWLGVRGEVKRPLREHPKRPITGLDCHRKEVSGERMWSLLKELSGTPDVLFTHVFLHNYCPVFFLKDSAKNVTPPELKAKERSILESLCDTALVAVVQLLVVEHVVGVGNYATDRTKAALHQAGIQHVKVSTLMHPSPVNPAANKGWRDIAIKQLTESHIIEYFKPQKMECTLMDAAFDQAREALAAGEVPVGCAFVHHGEIIALGRNTVNETHNATRHAEINCVDRTIEWCQNRGLDYRAVFPNVRVYVTVEPCGMCADALGQLSVAGLIFGCSNERFGGCGSVVNVPQMYGHSYEVVKGVRADEAVQLLRNFYKGENPNAPTEKAKRKT